MSDTHDSDMSGPIKLKCNLVPLAKLRQDRLQIAVVSAATVGIWLGNVSLLPYTRGVHFFFFKGFHSVDLSSVS